MTEKSWDRPSPDYLHKKLNSKQSLDEPNPEDFALLVPAPSKKVSVEGQKDLVYLWSEPLVQEVKKDGLTELVGIEMPL